MSPAIFIEVEVVSVRARCVDPKNVVKFTWCWLGGLFPLGVLYTPPGLCRFCVCPAPDMEFGVQD